MSSRGAEGNRLVVKLTGRGTQDIDYVCGRREENRTEATHRALRLLRLVEEARKGGGGEVSVDGAKVLLL